MGDNSAIILVEKLVYKTPLKVLDLTKNNLTNKFATVLAEVLIQDKSLVAVYLSWNNI